MAITGVDPTQAQAICRKDVCSDCWEVLHSIYDEKTRTCTITCSTPDCPCRGHVSAKFVEKELEESQMKRRFAQQALAESGAVAWIQKQPTKSEAEILKELGFK